MHNNVNKAGIELIKSFEGCVLTAYQDSVGIWTIGYGSIFYQDLKPVKKGDKITQQEAETELKKDIDAFANHLKVQLKSPLNDNQFSAIVSFAFNCGINSLKKSTLLKKVNINPNDKSISDEFLKWNKARVKGKLKVLDGLTRRRKAEADLYFKAL